jgi:hypothetical protein
MLKPGTVSTHDTRVYCHATLRHRCPSPNHCPAPPTTDSQLSVHIHLLVLRMRTLMLACMLDASHAMRCSRLSPQHHATADTASAITKSTVEAAGQPQDFFWHITSNSHRFEHQMMITISIIMWHNFRTHVCTNVCPVHCKNTAC